PRRERALRPLFVDRVRGPEAENRSEHRGRGDRILGGRRTTEASRLADCVDAFAIPHSPPFSALRAAALLRAWGWRSPRMAPLPAEADDEFGRTSGRRRSGSVRAASRTASSAGGCERVMSKFFKALEQAERDRERASQRARTSSPAALPREP